jgi:flagellar motility protein MotE (MotC chaperone)
MKNFLVLGLLALFLFSVSAALSVWLNQSKTAEATAEKEKEKEKDKDKGKGPKDAHDHDQKPLVPKADAGPSAAESGAALREREERVTYRNAQMQLVVADLRFQREATDKLMAKVVEELKNAGAEAAKLEMLAKDLKDKQLQADAGDKKNIDKLASVYEAMSPEAAAGQLKDMVENGKLDMAAKILDQMKGRNAARVLEVMSESTASQIVGRIEKLRPPPPVVPAKGP